jgi:hypothetical protein
MRTNKRATYTFTFFPSHLLARLEDVTPDELQNLVVALQVAFERQTLKQFVSLDML